MLDIPISPHFSKNAGKRFGDSLYCIVCGKAVKNPKHHVRLFWGSTAVTQVEAQEIIAREGEGGDCLYYPVGSDCLRKHSELTPYVEDARQAMLGK